MSKKLFAAIIIAIYAIGLVLSKPMDIKNVLADKPVSGPISLYITGHIRVLTSPISGVKVYLISTNKRSTVIAETRTDQEGVYKFTPLPKGRYVVKPLDDRFTFSPTQQMVNLIKLSFENIDFLAILN